MCIEAFENDSVLMKVSLMLVQLEIENALLEVLVKQVILFQKDLQSIFYFASHLLSRSVHLYRQSCTHNRIVNLLSFSLLFGWISLPVLDLILYQLLDLILIVKVVHLFDDGAPQWLLDLPVLDL